MSYNNEPQTLGDILASALERENPRKFWMVWREGTPTTEHRHYSRLGAVSEAKRLSLLHPGYKFHILEAKYCVESHNNPTTNITHHKTNP